MHLFFFEFVLFYMCMIHLCTHCFQAIVAMEFDANGSLLLTCDRLGSYFNIFRIVPHPAGACYSAVHHLYSLYRGDTPGSVQVQQTNLSLVLY